MSNGFVYKLRKWRYANDLKVQTIENAIKWSQVTVPVAQTLEQLLAAQKKS